MVFIVQDVSVECEDALSKSISSRIDNRIWDCAELKRARSRFSSFILGLGFN
jgi:hypothetical protein